ncbi:GNAT family N-acetyltransferase [Nonomuraea sp. NPDC050310]|uniref:GNAT family N-acetyltransferase n=1 Tax=Nonomuraea sp. NPDC050310 TaxID=3154935 RepID=UPI0033C6BAB1
MLAVSLTAEAELRELEPWRAEEFLAHLDRAREHIAPWVPASFVASDLEQARQVLQRYADLRARDGGGIWGIWLGGVLVGGVMFASFDAARGVCEVGCWLEPGAQGRGLITRAVERVVGWAVGERGIARVEWRTLPANARSIAVAKRLGMRLDGVLRQAVPGAGGGPRADIELWSLLAEEWQARTTEPRTTEPRTTLTPEAGRDKGEIDELTAAFYRLFGNAGGRVPDLAAIHDLFVPGGVIVQGGPRQALHDLEAFIRPRQALLTSGELTDFTEAETEEHTVIFGDVAQRLGRYTKRGVRDGVPFTGAGTKSMQFLKTPQGWRIAAMSWTDDPEQAGLSAAERPAG